MEDENQRLVWHGVALFFLGLLTGLIETKFHNPRMGLAAHLEGLMNGIWLVAVGAIWTKLDLSSSLRALAFWTLLCGTYANWAVTTLAAMLGTAALSPVTAVGYSASAWHEALVTGGFAFVGLLMITSTTILLWGLRRKPSHRTPT